MTGADDSVDPEALVDLSGAYPFVEWGILMSRSRSGTPRYPSTEWKRALGQRQQSSYPPMKLAAHVCGSDSRLLLAGMDVNRFDDTPFERIQLNGYSDNPQRHNLHPLLSARGSRRCILQCQGHVARSEAWWWVREYPQVDMLFDESGGRGIEPASWPDPPEWPDLLAPFNAPPRYGYAGGIGPENVVSVVETLIAKPIPVRVGIDMESRIRSDGDRKFDLGLVRQVLAAVEPFVEEL